MALDHRWQAGVRPGLGQLAHAGDQVDVVSCKQRMISQTSAIPEGSHF